jgi:hypothetical protein
MSTRMVSMIAVSLMLCAMSGAVSAQTLSSDQQEVWKVEHQQWQMTKDKDISWIDKLLHPNMQFWEIGAQMPRDFASLKHWGRYDADSGTILEYELLPISVTITGNVAVAEYHYMLARENYKKERETVTGHYQDVLVKDGGHWQFIAWAGGDDPKK